MLEKDLENKSTDELKEMLKEIRSNRRMKPEPKKGKKARKKKEQKIKINLDDIPDDDLKGLI